MKISIVIQAGGQSSRMGVDKGMVELCGKPMIANIIDRLCPFADEMIITTNQPEKYQRFGIPLAEDIYKEYGALAGLHTALFSATNEMVFVIACDLPFINLNLFNLLKNTFESNEVDLVIPKTNMGFEPFYAIYRKTTCLNYVTEAILSGKKRLISWFESANIITIPEIELRKYDPNLDSFANINTPEELLKAQSNCGQN